jgi:four helix bundle protein
VTRVREVLNFKNMENKEFSKKLEARTRAFAIRIIRLSILLPNTVEGKVIRNQLTKAGTSVGANYREANRARSKADFTNKIKICESEASETDYWIAIVREMEWIEVQKLEPVIIETNELLSIFTSIGKTLNG